MAGFRNKFIKIVSGISGVVPVSILSGLSQQKLILPVYHLVSDEDVPHIKHLYSYKNKKDFTQDLDFLLKHYTPIDLSELIKIVRKEKDINAKKFLLTFDDGLRSFFEVIAPILLKKGVPAINFLNSAFIDNADLFYRYKASVILDAYYRLASEKQRGHIVAKIEAELKISINSFPDFIKSISYKQQNILDQIAILFSIDFANYLKLERPYLSSVQIRELIQDGFYFGAHSHDHPEYWNLTLEDQLWQTRRSIKEVLSAFQLPYKLFAFPFTDYQVSAAFFERIHEEDLVDISFGSAGLKKDTSSTHLQRIPMEMGTLSARKIITSEMIYFLCKTPFGKNRILRI